MSNWGLLATDYTRNFKLKLSSGGALATCNWQYLCVQPRRGRPPQPAGFHVAFSALVRAHKALKEEAAAQSGVSLTRRPPDTNTHLESAKTVRYEP